MSLIEIKAEIPAATVEAADTVLLELEVEGWSLLEDVIAKRAWVVGVFTAEVEARARWAELQPLLQEVGEPVFRELADQDWRDSYKAHFKAWQFGRLHWVPVWERATYALPDGDVVIWLDPGLAFGTGNHETTRLCCERLVAFAARRKGDKIRVIDAGCGSGILALSAVKLGYRQVAAFDNDPLAIDVSRENAVLNEAEGQVDFFVGDLVTGLGGREAELVLANIQADVLMKFAPQLLAAVAPGGVLVLSGILSVELEKVCDVFSALAPAWPVESRILGEWSDLMLIRRG